MRLTMYTDFSLRVLIYLGTNDRQTLTTIQEISDAYRISKNHLTKVTFELGKAGFIETVRGRGGGIRLAQDPEKINIGTVVRKMEDDFHLVECFDRENNRCPIAPVCGLKGVLGKALHAYLMVLEEYTLADLLVNKEGLQQMFFEQPEKVVRVPTPLEPEI
ncbi:Rrf2 family transcriptional regulator [Planomicrobium sp. YIM 101495]|uniref:RrF2 family transcriptional regulator n=1 Tax=Planomicrobium sp. YIM 101495 TaxID=2665160 RepID=UPI0012B9D8FA|nr:Rrf2 family transcriptional regulator [Planomicrobium sp. YIM 101495]MTD30956.1 Rrf2 family transcriptional regulator [Planomicrobium sp. YIM 101495]